MAALTDYSKWETFQDSDDDIAAAPIAPSAPVAPAAPKVMSTAEAEAAAKAEAERAAKPPSAAMLEGVRANGSRSRLSTGMLREFMDADRCRCVFCGAADQECFWGVNVKQPPRHAAKAALTLTCDACIARTADEKGISLDDIGGFLSGICMDVTKARGLLEDAGRQPAAAARGQTAPGT